MSEITPLSSNPWRLKAAALENDSIEGLRESGLTNLLIDSQFGGESGSFRDAVEALSGAGQVGLSLATVLASHYSATGLFVTHGDRDAVAVIGRHAANNWSLWSDLRLDPDLPLRVEIDSEGGATVTGVTAPTHGAGEADTVVATVPHPSGTGTVALVLPVDREGLEFGEPIAQFGLRRSPAAVVTFDQVRVEPGELVTIDAEETILGGLRALFDGAIVAGASFRSVERAAELTRVRKMPRPVPGVTAARTDPLSQTMLGTGLLESNGALATVLRAAGGFDRELSGDEKPVPSRIDSLTVRALAANEVAITSGLSQGKNVFEVVGTSGSANKHGFDELWRDVRVLSLRQPRAERRRQIGQSYLDRRDDLAIAGVAS